MQHRVAWRSLSMAAVVATWTCHCGSADAPATPTRAGSTGASISASSSSSAVAAGAGGAEPTTASASMSTGLGGLDAGPLPSCAADDPRAVPLQVWALPDAGEKPFVDALSQAKTSIRVMVYLMGYGGILDTLEQKAKAGLKVQVILDTSEIATNQKYFDALTAAGAEVHWSDPSFTYMHAKAFVVDGVTAMISTGNYSLSQMQKERNYVALDEDPSDVESLVGLFDADWNKTAPDLTCTRLLVSPVNSRPRILDVIDAATKTLDIESMQLADTDVRKAVAARHAAGVAVRVLLADPAWITTNTDAAQFLATNGIEARYLAAPVIHVKAMLVDAERAYLGSENLSYTSLSKNREVGLVTLEAEHLTLMAATFEKDWAIATPFP